MKNNCLKLVLALVASLVLTTSVSAAPMSFWSGDGGDNLVSSVNGNTGAVTTITPHPVWGDVSAFAGLADDTAKWISYADTGFGGIVAPDAPSRTRADATMEVERTFSIGGGDFHGFFLADDTMEVEFSGPSGLWLIPFALTQLDPCSGNIIGCAGQHKGEIQALNLQPGLYTLKMWQVQTNKDVSGMQFAGTYESVPEPATMTLLAAGLFGAAFTMRRRRSRG